jgi:ribosomal protein L11 methyltransferase
MLATSNMRDRYIWRKQAGPAWLREHETELHARFAERLALIEQPRRKRTTVEISFATGRDAAKLRKRFGGRVVPIPRKFPLPVSKPVKIGARLIITNVGGASMPRRLIIPAAGAFGTGEHATTAMCLRMLERISRNRSDTWTMLDAGTGSGILALAANLFGARNVIAIDSDPRAVAIARGNARLNRIDNVLFKVADVTKYKPPRRLDVIAANLFSELLIKAIPRWQRALTEKGFLIVSGILRAQEQDVVRALRKSGFTAQEIRRRGKWIAILARRQKAG